MTMTMKDLVADARRRVAFGTACPEDSPLLMLSKR